MLKGMTGAIKGLDWSLGSWRFGVSYFLVPWTGVVASLRMRRDGADWPLWFRLWYFTLNYWLLGIAAFFLWAGVSVAMNGYWGLVAPFLLLGAAHLAVLALRLHLAYQFSPRGAKKVE